MELSVVIVCWNVKDYLQKCLASVYRETAGVSFEIFVVDNASKDGSVEMVRELFPSVKVIANKENLGFARANNLALKQCAGEYVLFLNPDTEIKNKAVEKLLEFLKANPGAAVAAPKLIHEDGRVQLLCRNFPSPATDLGESLFLDIAFPKSQFFNHCFMGEWKHDSTREVEQPAGACLLVRMESLKKTGFYDERFFLYYEDVDLCYRIKKAGGKIFLLHDVLVVHHGCKSSIQIENESFNWGLESRIKFFRKHYGKAGVFILGSNLVIRTLLVYLVIGPLSLIIKRPRNIKVVRKIVGSLWRAYLKT